MQTATTGGNCGQLLALIQMVDRQLAKAVAGKVVSSDVDVKSSLRSLGVLLVKAGRKIQAYGQHGFMQRFLRSGSDVAAFEALDRDIRSIIQVRPCGCWCWIDIRSNIQVRPCG